MKKLKALKLKMNIISTLEYSAIRGGGSEDPICGLSETACDYNPTAGETNNFCQTYWTCTNLKNCAGSERC